MVRPLALSAIAKTADHRHRRHRLDRRGDEGDDHATADRLLVGDDVGRDDGLAVPGPERMNHAIKKAQARKADGCDERVSGFEPSDAAGQLALHGLLRVHDPAEERPDETRRMQRHRLRRTECGRRARHRSGRTWRTRRRSRCASESRGRCRLRGGASRHRSPRQNTRVLRGPDRDWHDPLISCCM